MTRNIAIFSVVGPIILCGIWFVSCVPEKITKCTRTGHEPNIAPDYTGLTIPANVSPLNFRVLEKGKTYCVKIHSHQGTPIEVFSKTSQIRIPLRKWRALLAANPGREMSLNVYVKDENGQWQQFNPIVNTIAPETIDDTLVYRFMKPIYNAWKDMGIYQRTLTNFDVSSVIHGRSLGEGCVNCHSFAGSTSDTTTIGLRSPIYGSHTLLARNGSVDKINAKWGYTAWHPSGQMAVYSVNKVRQFFHVGGMEVRDVVDLDSALACYYMDDKKIVCPSELSDKKRLETYPTWSPDGRYLYFCSGPILWQTQDAIPPENYDKLKYDLRRVAYDVDTDQWGKVETVLAASETGLSILLPRISPDGRFLLFSMCKYGCFPVYQPSSDLYLMDLSTRQYRRLAINSPASESWHSWSSNSRWIAFSSKRQGGALTRTYFSYMDKTGQFSKPFVLPQKNPTHYDSLLMTYSVPELIQGGVKVQKSLLARMARAEPTELVENAMTGATPKASSPAPWRERE